MLPLARATDTDLGAACTLIGWGKGKGALVSGQGWEWGDAASMAKRWGTSTTLSSTAALSYSGYSYNAIYTTFEASFRVNASGQTEASATDGDSGAGLFQQFSGTWKLSGILTVVGFDTDNYPDGNTFYNAGYPTYAVRMKDIANKLRFTQWKETRGMALATPPEDDQDGDGAGLLEEYAFGGDPSVPSPGLLPQSGIEGTEMAITYQLERTRTDLTVQIEESIDLVTWNPAPVASTATVSDNGTIRTFKAKVPLNGSTRKFLRLKVTAIPSA